MEENKENLKTLRKTKIPLPLDPLPQVPTSLICSLSKSERKPLKTISLSRALPSQININNSCRKNVTLRKPRQSPLDWEYKVFIDKPRTVFEDRRRTILDKNDKYKNDEAIQFECKKDAFGVPECNLLSLDVAPKVSTPKSNVYLEPARIKNIKQSLKRPHSRELQGRLSPIKKELRRSKWDAKCKLNFGDRIVDRLQSPDIITKRYTAAFCKYYTKDLFQNLINTERKPMGTPMLTSITRTCIVNWIMKINGEDGDPGVVQMACWYLDSLSSKKDISLEQLQVVAAACYWIAQKMYGPTIVSSRLVKNGGDSYTSTQLRRAEEKILVILNFPPQPVVAQDYITYLSWWCDSDNPGVIEVAASFFCLCGLLVDKSLACEYPSVLGSAAIHNTISLLGKTHLMPRLLSNYVFTTAIKKSANFNKVLVLMRRSVRVVGHPCSEYRAPYEHYSRPPHILAKKILQAVNSYSISKKFDNV